MAKRFDEVLSKALTTYLSSVASRLNRCLPTDGSEAMEGPLSMGGFSISNVENLSTTATGIITAGFLRLTSTTVPTTGSTGHAFQIGTSITNNLTMGPTSILARNNGSAADLTINGTGGKNTIFGGPLDISNVLAGQIVFPSAQNVSTNANTLDDIEEGTYTPTMTAQAGSLTTVAVTGTYFKVGRHYFCGIRADLTTNGTGSGSLTVTLPATCSGSNWGVAGQRGSSGHTIAGVILTGGTAIQFIKLYDSSYPGVNGANYELSFHFESTA